MAASPHVLPGVVNSRSFAGFRPQAGSRRRGASFGWIDVALICLFLIGVYTNYTIQISAKVPFPSVPSGVAGLLLLWRWRDRVTTGAASDIQQATGLARRYVSQWGLSDEIGPILVGDNEQELFLGRELQTRREVSERTAQLVDSEVSRVIKEAYARATAVLQENMDLLHTVAAALLDRETLTGDEVAALARGETLPPRPVSPPPSAPALAAPVMHPKPSKPPLFGGPEVAPA